MRIVDTRGQLCPAPIIAAKRALRESDLGESFIILTDNNTSYNNLCKFLKDNNTEFIAGEDKGTWKLTVKKLSKETSLSNPGDNYMPSIPHFEKGDYIVVLSSDRVGEGDEELGRLLVMNFIKALKDLSTLPGKIVLYNSGVRLAAKESSVVEHLVDLEKMGVEIVLCSTCVGFYKLEESISIGSLGNMFSIAEYMTSAGKIIKP